MTSPHKDHPNLEVVAERPHLSVAPALEDDWREQSVIDQWDAEHQLVGALMWLTAAQARTVLELVPDSAIFRPHTRWAYELIRRTVDAGQNPSPVIVLDAGRHYSGSDALNPEQSPNSSEHRRLALYLFEVYQSAVAPTDTVDSYAAMVLEEAYRRAFTLCGIRMQQLGEAGAERTDLNDQFIAIRDELADLRRRADKAAKHEKSPK
ncbi:hypothetical protein FZI85_27830 [Mycobacterium sp. CBMA293]|uniref:DNA helicase DnaB-like N-terminal domain-containing protein n=1 Tax=Mycolicibacterium sp. CBMA 213 TaxID=1968788 RepID=A0A1S6GKW5_9MYCO|nr:MULTISPECIES: hypothetical protein [unclassified Mycolicibacterium]AQS22504.1 hypothetical protein pCBMA213_2_00140 [Mycolicibacterium sp. CBMA 213]MUL48404.1 hypothetical protein [Mycolicibacterium sp. CBMA 360]MUL62416.1 hypothetical protein [Mycolicibacterium sp. CBMA 335]MUM04553.1 hypothetical protein [Mycolicibacterium sp. CBMA 213]MUM14816.1 hypothetical protein [Mycolicibacterium sp. CBMA 293]